MTRSLRLAIALVALLAGATPDPAAAVDLADTPIVSVGGAVTEIIASLGAADRIRAVDTTSTHPAAAVAGKPNVGYMRQLSAEGILALGPVRVIAVEGAGPPDVLKLLAEAGVRIDRVTDEPSPAGLLAKVRTISALVGRKAEGEALAAEIEAGFAALAQDRATRTAHPRVLFVIALQNGRPMAAGAKSAAAAMMGLAGADNAVSGFDGYKPLSDEAIVAAAPDAVVFMDRPGLTAADLLALPAIAATPAGRRHAVFGMDGLALLGFGPRAPAAARDLMAALDRHLVGAPK
ncbi:heme/hemin ABC transporter substrate-binding protein [Prosthecomicrobium hirschii]|uniref:heme/hemin ABC transporter substrate-binding protein n=1 Tax=Prosthecodimorpha hirschii TaxID=665126 RepID=UPI00221FFB19|nr:ABC transporter substrate-binding protein [Prosthecomicrobium hirschii]MCW1842565.1 ABC transporter substrate-binding protein [Prosthecomicrobium hirschii]